jgi:hypothetical protein
MNGARAAMLLVLVAAPSPADAQLRAGGGTVRRLEIAVRRLEIAVGAGVLGGASLGQQDARIRANSQDDQPFRLFTTDSRLAAAPVIAVRAGFMVTRRYGVEAAFTFGRPEVRTSLSDDAEEAPPLVAIERIDQYLVDGGLVVALEELRLGPLLPVVSGGGGYLRQLHEGQTVVEEGHFFHAGIGVRHWLAARDRGLLKGAGVRADARLYVFNGGIAVREGPRPHGAISGSVFVVF